MRRREDKLSRIFKERIDRLDYFLNRLRSRRLLWTLPVSIILLFVGAFILQRFEGALTHDEAIALGYEPFPSHWEAGVRSNGDYYQWYLPSKHPVLYNMIRVIHLSSVLWFFLLIFIEAIDWLLYKYRESEIH